MSLEFRKISAASSLFVVRRFFCHFLLREKQTKKSVILLYFSNLKFLFITADVLNSARFDSISFCEKFEISLAFNWFPLGLFSLAKMASKAQKPKWNFCKSVANGYRYSRALQFKM